MTSKVDFYFHPDGTFDKIWRNKEGELHREDGPAIEHSNGTRFWFKNGLKHREDGPTFIWESGEHEYYLNGQYYSIEDYLEETEILKNKKDKESSANFEN